MSAFSDKYDTKSLLLLIGIMIIIIFFWNFILFYPLKLFTVLLHEISHGLAAILSGGKIIQLEISKDLGGLATTSGGWRALILPAGYLGSMIFGGIIVISASRLKNDKFISYIIGVLILIITALFIRTWFGILFGVLFGGGMIVLGKFAPDFVNDIVLKIIGMTSVLYAIIDIKQDLINRTVPGSDAYAMSQLFILPPVFWGILWIIIALIASFFILRIAVKKNNRSYIK